MSHQSSLSYVIETLENLNTHFQEKIDSGELDKVKVNNESNYIIFFSIGNPKIRARVYKEVTTDLAKGFNSFQQKAIDLVRKKNIDPAWIKVDVVKDVQEITFAHLTEKIAGKRRNYFRSGISFDATFSLAFLEQEINGNAMIRSVNKGPQELHEKNINRYINYKYGPRFPFMKENYEQSSVFTFQTIGAFKAREEEEIVDLQSGELTNGIRVSHDIKEESQQLIEKSTYFLVNQVKETGQFEYGYFPAFARRIGTYNILRHASSLYSMAEGYELIKDKRIIEAVENGIAYLIREAIVYKENSGEQVAFVVDQANHNEIKLGSNATAILAMTKYMEVTGSTKYLEVAQALARGILQMKTPSGGFMHVLSYPGFEVKDLFRIIYYEGEAVFSLLRLFAIDKNELWLDEVKKSFDYFIKNEHWKHHDHWLSYAANEITIYEPEDKYFIFGLKNCNGRLDFIYRRDTTYPTFLELTMAAYKMVQTIKKLDKEYLLEHIDDDLLEKTIDHRAVYQRVGFFYPEIAMYKKNPGLIVDGFFVRHHSFRVRIDDVEHYLSSYCQYLQHRLNKEAL